MRELEAIASAISSLAEAVRSVATELARAREPPVPDKTEEADLGGWELVEEQAFVPGAPGGFNSTIRFELESGPPSTPGFLVDLAKRKLRSAVASPVDRARAAFCAGYWFAV